MDLIEGSFSNKLHKTQARAEQNAPIRKQIYEEALEKIGETIGNENEEI